MFEWLFRGMKKSLKNTRTKNPAAYGSRSQTESRETSSELDQNNTVLKEIFDHCDVLVVHEFSLGNIDSIRSMLVYLGPLVDQDMLQKNLMGSLLNVNEVPKNNISDWLISRIIPSGEARKENIWERIANDIAAGMVALFINGENFVILLPVMEDLKRQISQPVTETTARGSQSAFNEDIRTNIALLQKRLPTTRLALKNFKIGELSKTEISMIYLKGYVKQELLEEIEERLNRIKIDGIPESGYLEEFIQDNPWSVFSAIDSTERPDRLAGHILEGHVGLLINNTPFALILPMTLVSQIQSPEDYSNRYWFSSFIRLLRWGALLFSALLPSFYISVISYHQELIPLPLLLSIAVSRERIPFPGFLEALIMELTFEILREAGVRIPKSFGQTISIVGAIVIGQAAVMAGLVSPIMVIVVALTAIASYTIPSSSLANSVRILRFPFMIAAAFMGLFGMIVGVSIISYHLCSLRSFGVPYLSPLAPLSYGDLKDTLIRAPAWKMNLRPRLVGGLEPQRQHKNLKPGPSDNRTKIIQRRIRGK